MIFDFKNISPQCEKPLISLQNRQEAGVGLGVGVGVREGEAEGEEEGE